MRLSIAVMFTIVLAGGALAGFGQTALVSRAPGESIKGSTKVVIDDGFIKAQEDQVKALFEEAWRELEGVEIERPPGEPPAPWFLWSMAYTLPFPLAWPPDGGGRLAYYATAARMGKGLADAHHQAAPWARVEVCADGSAEPRLELLEPRVREAGIQDVRPATAEEMAIGKTGPEAIRQLFALTLQTGMESVVAPVVKAFYRAWSDGGYVIKKEVSRFHLRFFDWLKR